MSSHGCPPGPPYDLLINPECPPDADHMALDRGTLRTGRPAEGRFFKDVAWTAPAFASDPGVV